MLDQGHAGEYLDRLSRLGRERSCRRCLTKGRAKIVAWTLCAGRHAGRGRACMGGHGRRAPVPTSGAPAARLPTSRVSGQIAAAKGGADALSAADVRESDVPFLTP